VLRERALHQPDSKAGAREIDIRAQ
jgi:hypothetical protein